MSSARFGAAFGLAFISLGFAGTVEAATDVLNIRMTADNMFSVYVSTSPTVRGTRVTMTREGTPGTGQVITEPGPDGSPYDGFDWSRAWTGAFSLSGTSNLYVNVVAENKSGASTDNPVGFIAALSLVGSSFTLANDSSKLLTQANSTNPSQSFWRVAQPVTDTYSDANGGWNLINTWQAPVVVNPQPSAWTNSTFHNAFTSGAQWIWNNQSQDMNPRFFQTTIAYMAVPEPTTMLLGSMALMPLLAYRRRSRRA